MSGAADKWVAVGVVARPHALDGGVLVKPFTRSSEDFIEAPLERVRLRRKGQIVGTLTIASMSIHKGLPYVFFEEVVDRNGAEEIVGAELVIHEDERWELGEGEYYIDDLAGIEVVDTAAGRSYGPVLKAEEGAAHDYLLFAHPDKPGQQVRLPLVKEFVLSIDLKAGRAEVRLPEGLLDL